MIAEIGHFCLLLGALICAGQMLLPYTHRTATNLAERASGLAIIQFTLVSVAMLALLFSFADSDFSVYSVFLHSHSAKPFIYKLTGSWGNHEGSMLLWAWILSLYGALLARQNFGELTFIKATTLGVQAFLSLGFLCFILATSNPFARIFPVPGNGQGLNPLLQDIGLAIHPPMLYLGYVGFGIIFSLAVAALIHRAISPAWAKLTGRWIALTWAFLTFGIGLGSWWAYRELGWGGWWFWDPVENVSVMPWLAGTALLHTNMILEKRGRCANWTTLLAILTFSLSLIGTFIVRSGLLTSVHAFASDPERGAYILAFFAVVTGGALLLWGMRQTDTRAQEPLTLLSREGLIMGNNILLLSATATILLATLYPLIADLVGLPSVSIGPPYFNQTVLPLLAPLAIMSALAPQVGWRGDQRSALLRAMRVPALICLLLFGMIAWLFEPRGLIWWGGVLLSAWLIVGTCSQAWRETQGSFARARHLPARRWGMLISHVGVGVFICAVTLNMLDKRVMETPSAIGQSHAFEGYDITYSDQQDALVENFLQRRATIDIETEEKRITLHPETRFYAVRQMLTTEAATHSNLARDLYVVIGQTHDNQPGLRFYIEPAIRWVWIGFLLMGLGGLLAWKRSGGSS